MNFVIFFATELFICKDYQKEIIIKLLVKGGG